MEDYFKLGKHKKRPLNNPLAAEFGIYSERDLDEFILNHLPGFALVRLYVFFIVCLMLVSVKLPMRSLEHSDRVRPASLGDLLLRFFGGLRALVPRCLFL